jgi:Flp pilus assembly protein TadD
VTHAVLGISYEDKRMYPQTIAEYQNALQLGGSPAEIRGLLGYAYAVSGNRAGAEKTIAELKALLPNQSRAALDLAVVYSGLGDKESALSWLEKAQQLHVSDLIGIGKDPHFVELHTDRRFQSLAQRVSPPTVAHL